MAAYLKIQDIDGESFSNVVDLLATPNETDLNLGSSDLAFLRELAGFVNSDDIVIDVGILDHDTGHGRLKPNGPTDTFQFIKFDGNRESIAPDLEEFSLNFEQIKFVESANSLKLLFNEGQHRGQLDDKIVGTDLTVVDDFLL